MEEIGTAVTVSVSAKQRFSFSVKILMGIATYFASGIEFLLVERCLLNYRVAFGFFVFNFFANEQYYAY